MLDKFIYAASLYKGNFADISQMLSNKKQNINNIYSDILHKLAGYSLLNNTISYFNGFIECMGNMKLP